MLRFPVLEFAQRLRALAADIARVDRSLRLEHEHVRDAVADRAVLDSLFDDIDVVGEQIDVTAAKLKPSSSESCDRSHD